MHEPELTMSAATIICPACTREAAIVETHIAQPEMVGVVHCPCGRIFETQMKTVWFTQDNGAWKPDAQPKEEQ